MMNMAKNNGTDDRGTSKRDDATAVTKTKSAELAIAYDESRASSEIESAVILARRFPRDKMAAYAEIMVACERKSFAERAYYRFPRGGKQISGPSVNLARMMAAEWGNVRYGGDVVRDDDKSRKVRGWAWDVERNVFVSADDEFKKLIQRKINKGRPNETTEWITPDERDLRELTNRRIAVLVRNCLLQIVPADFVEDAMNKVFGTIESDVTDDQKRAATAKRMVVAFRKIGVTTAMIESYFNKSVDALTPADVVDLGGIFRAINDGHSTVAETFGVANRPTSGKIDINGFRVIDEKDSNDGDAEPKPKPKRKRGRPKKSKSAVSDTNASADDEPVEPVVDDPTAAKNAANANDETATTEPPGPTEPESEPPTENKPAAKYTPNESFNCRLDEIMALPVSDIEPSHVDELCVHIAYPRIDDPANVDLLALRGNYKSAIGALRDWAIAEGLR